MLHKAFVLMLSLLAGACAADHAPGALTAEPFAVTPPQAKGGRGGLRMRDLAATDGTVQAGVASWYGPRHHGRPTASGARYDMRALTAAHPTLPMGTRLRVIHAVSGRSVVVTVNDRGPHVGNRILDLSWRAAQELGMVRMGIPRVLVSAMPPPSVAPRTRRPPPLPDHPSDGAAVAMAGAFGETPP